MHSLIRNNPHATNSDERFPKDALRLAKRISVSCFFELNSPSGNSLQWWCFFARVPCCGYRRPEGHGWPSSHSLVSSSSKCWFSSSLCAMSRLIDGDDTCICGEILDCFPIFCQTSAADINIITLGRHTDSRHGRKSVSFIIYLHFVLLASFINLLAISLSQICRMILVQLGAGGPGPHQIRSVDAAAGLGTVRFFVLTPENGVHVSRIGDDDESGQGQKGSRDRRE